MLDNPVEEQSELSAMGEDEYSSEDFNLSYRRKMSFQKPLAPIRNSSRQRNISPSFGVSHGFDESSEGTPLFLSTSPSSTSMLARYGRSRRGSGAGMFDEEAMRKRIAELEDALSISEVSNQNLKDEVELLKKRCITETESKEEYQRTSDSQLLEIETLREEVSALQSRLNNMEREYVDFEKKTEVSLELYLKEKEGYEAKIQNLSGQINTWKQQVLDLQDEITELGALQTSEVEEYANRQNAHFIVIETLKKDKQVYEKAQSQIQELEIQLDIERRRREAAEDNNSSEMNLMIEEMRTELISLSETNRILIDENESLRLLLSTHNKTLNGKRSISDLDQLQKPRLRNIPRRSASVLNLAGTPTTAGTSSLATELLKSQITHSEPEIEKLREENRALVHYIVSTLDSVTLMSKPN
ncbi:hypothetical protein HK098_003536 [Nowakowskiella sp. JEL0407]|nr:hypothetical protein HK098_003536 [Nowakowskiella sp. JEL0407]